MNLRYEPTRITTGVGYDDTTRITRAPVGEGGAIPEQTRLIRDHPSPLGIQAVQVPRSPDLEVTLIRVDEGQDEIIWGPVRSEVIGLWHEDRGRNYEVPVELSSGQRLDLQTRNFGSTSIEGDVRVRAVRPAQLRDYRQDIEVDFGEVPTQGFADASIDIDPGGAKQRIVTVPTGEWAFDRAYISVTTPADAPPLPSVSLSMDERSLFSGVPFQKREIYFPLQRLRRDVKLNVSSTQAPLHVDLLVPLYSGRTLLDAANDTTAKRDI